MYFRKDYHILGSLVQKTSESLWFRCSNTELTRFPYIHDERMVMVCIDYCKKNVYLIKFICRIEQSHGFTAKQTFLHFWIVTRSKSDTLPRNGK